MLNEEERNNSKQMLLNLLLKNLCNSQKRFILTWDIKCKKKQIATIQKRMTKQIFFFPSNFLLHKRNEKGTDEFRMCTNFYAIIKKFLYKMNEQCWGKSDYLLSKGCLGAFNSFPKNYFFYHVIFNAE